MQVTNAYVGRFAPSPSGPLHFGSLVAALASYLDARNNKGVWLLRIEDLDPPRESKTAPDEIVAQLHQFNFRWDGEPVFQSQHLHRYESCLNQLIADNQVYLCTCSRKSFGKVYPGKCRNLSTMNTAIMDTASMDATSMDTTSMDATKEEPAAVRLCVGSETTRFLDLFQSEQTFDLEADIGDFIIKRKDGLFAYQLAVVVDDHDQGITHVVRGSDLLDSTPRQICLATKLGFSAPQFGHVPVVTDPAGDKLSKQTKAKAISSNNAIDTIKLALKVLGQPIPNNHELDQIMKSAIKNWQRGLVPKQMQVLSPVL